MQAQHQRYRGAKSAARAPRKRPNRPAHRSLEIAVALLVAGVALVGCGEPAAIDAGGGMGELVEIGIRVGGRIGELFIGECHGAYL